MKNIVKTFVIVSVFISSFAFAAKKDDRITLRSRQIVESATPDDWKALAQAAAICVDKRTNLTQASEWLDKSMAIKVTSYNLEVKGDYMLLSNQPDQAMSFYIKALQTGLNSEAGFDVTNLQTKISQLKSVKN